LFIFPTENKYLISYVKFVQFALIFETWLFFTKPKLLQLLDIFLFKQQLEINKKIDGNNLTKGWIHIWKLVPLANPVTSI